MKKFFLICIFIPAILVAWFFWYERPRSSLYCIARMHEIQQNILHFAPTNSWRDVQAAGGDTSGILPIIFGRTHFHYFLLQEGNINAEAEFRAIFENRKQPKIGDGNFLYAPEYERQIEPLRENESKLAPWWNKDLRSKCTWVYFSTNCAGIVWQIDAYCISTGTNAVLLTHVQKTTAD